MSKKIGREGARETVAGKGKESERDNNWEKATDDRRERTEGRNGSGRNAGITGEKGGKSGVREVDRVGGREWTGDGGLWRRTRGSERDNSKQLGEIEKREQESQ